jgi:hypothetical protein
MLNSRSNVHPFTPAAPAQRATPACPRCGEPLLRVPRRWSDRLRSLFKPVRRYRCDWLGCNWAGTLSDDERANAAATDAAAPEDAERRS